MEQKIKDLNNKIKNYSYVKTAPSYYLLGKTYL